MKNKEKRWLGYAFIVLAIIYALSILNILPAIPTFHGWWTLFLIVPGVISLSRTGATLGNVLLITFGVYFLLDANGINLSSFVAPIALIAIGIYLIWKK